MEKTPKFHPNPDLKLMDQIREVLRFHHYAYRTEQAYCQWVLRYIRYHGGNTHPAELHASDVERFLSDLVNMLKSHLVNNGRRLLPILH
ncbi:MAG: phage integrase N-terminal SAM-like domain-containing protein [Desulfuromonadales bacterium]|nr:phage integrase N-terminal SAM-like domain-containing protein [Desulfuromonadales bacterium]